MRFEENELPPGDPNALRESTNVINKAKSILQQSMRKENPTSIKRELSDHLDTRASNPIHVNNLKSLFGIEKNVNAGDLPSEKNEEQEMERIDSVKSGSRHSSEHEDGDPGDFKFEKDD